MQDGVPSSTCPIDLTSYGTCLLQQKVEGDLREVKSEFAQATQSLKFANQQIENLKYQMEQETEV